MGSIPRATPQPDGSIIHTVGACETLSGLEFTYGVSIDQIRQLNNLQSNIIYPGQQLIIQGPQQAAPPTDAPASPTATPADVAEEPDTSTGDSGDTGGDAPVSDDALAKGTICVLSWEDVNENRLREPQEPMLAGITFMLTDSGNSSNSETYTTDGVEDWHCFTELDPSNYTVTWTAEDFLPTTDQTWIADLTAGETLNREFGAVQGEGSSSEAEGEEDSGGLPPLVTAGIAALGVIFLLTGIGAAGYFFLARRAQISS
jgi:LysM repeat protein